MNSSTLLNQIHSDLFPSKPTKREQKMVQIIEAAISLYATIGAEHTTYEKIAAKCKITHPLIQYYFQDKTVLFELAIKYIRLNFQQLAIKAIQKEKTADKMLEAYIASTFVWIKKYPKHVKTWMHYLYLCTYNSKSQILNTELVDQGHQRITQLVLKGIEEGVFKSSHPSHSARMIQTIITGALLTVITENKRDNANQYEMEIKKACFALLQKD